MPGVNSRCQFWCQFKGVKDASSGCSLHHGRFATLRVPGFGRDDTSRNSCTTSTAIVEGRPCSPIGYLPRIYASVEWQFRTVKVDLSPNPFINPPKPLRHTRLQTCVVHGIVRHRCMAMAMSYKGHKPFSNGNPDEPMREVRCPSNLPLRTA